MTHTLSSWFTLPLYKLLALYDSLFLSLWLILQLSDLLSLSMTYSPPLWLHHSLYDLLFPSMTYSPSICPITPFMTYFTALIFSLWLTLFHYIWLFLSDLFSLSMTYTPLHDLPHSLWLALSLFLIYHLSELPSRSMTFSVCLTLSLYISFLSDLLSLSMSYPPFLWITFPFYDLLSLSMTYFPLYNLFFLSLSDLLSLLLSSSMIYSPFPTFFMTSLWLSL